MNTAFLFPGQGSQKVGMGDTLRSLPAARAVFEEVDDALGRPLSRLILVGPQDELTLTRNAQPALMTVSVAALRALEAEVGEPISEFATFLAGHSLGEYSALVAAKALDVATAARLLQLRGEAMQSAVPVGEGAMAAVLGLDVNAVENVLAQNDGIVDIGNDNADGQVVISGAQAAVTRAGEALRAAGAKRVQLLHVSAPFHCRLMGPAAERMADALEVAPLHTPVVPVIANVLARPLSDVDAIRRALVAQVCGRVRWRETMSYLASAGTEQIVEAGSGKVLAGLARRAVPGGAIYHLETVDHVHALAGTFGRLAA